MPVASDVLAYLYQALATPIGIEIETNDPQRLRQQLYAARRDAKNPELDRLTISLSRKTPETAVWIFADAKET